VDAPSGPYHDAARRTEIAIKAMAVVRKKSIQAEFRQRVETWRTFSGTSGEGVIRRSARTSVRSVPSRLMARFRSRLDFRTVVCVLGDVLRFASSILRPRAQLAAENLFLRKQLALYAERGVKPRRADDAIRLTVVGLSRLIDWRHLLIIVKPETLIRWHRKGFQLFWRSKSKPEGRPQVLRHLQQLIAEMAAATCTWGEERIASELLVKLGIRVSPRTVRRYMPSGSSGSGARRGAGSQAWSAFVRNHARSVLACDFFVTVTAGFRVLYVLVVPAESGIGTSLSIRRRSGRHSNSGWWFRSHRIDL
jgi:putative transposase